MTTESNVLEGALDRPFGNLMAIAWEMYLAGRNGLTLRFDNPDNPTITGVVEIRFHARHGLKASDVPAWEMPQELFPTVLPPGWNLVQRGDDGAVYQTNVLTVVFRGLVLDDGRRWLHVSVGREQIRPTLEDVRMAAKLFFGDGKRYVPVPPDDTNDHWHLWHCLEGDLLPEFPRGDA